MDASGMSLDVEEGEGDVDRFSALPDSVICRILSLVTTKEAVATSILGKRWRFVWTNLQNLVFDFRKHRLENFIERGYYTPGSGRTPSETELEKLNDRVDQVQGPYKEIVHSSDLGLGAILRRVFSLHNAVDLDIFQLTYRLFDLKDVDFCECIEKVVARGVKNIEIACVYVSPFFYGNRVPVSLLNSKNLVSMRLSRCYICIRSGKTVCLVNLKRLYLDDVKSQKTTTLSHLIAGCPVLEELTVKQLRVADFPTFKIKSQTLRVLNAVFTGFGMIDIDGMKWDVVAPNVTTFRLSFGKLPYSLVPLPFKALRKFSNLKWLGLRYNFFSLLDDPVPRMGSAPKLPNLEGLELGTDVVGLFRLLQNAVNLKHLKVEYYLLEWEYPPKAPRCLKHSIETISIVGFSGGEEQLQIINYFIENATALKSISVCCDPLSCTSAEAKHLEAIKRTFNSLEYHVHEESDDLWKSGCYVNSV